MAFGKQLDRDRALLNIAVIVGLFRLPGTPCPSSVPAVSSIVTNLAAIGIIINIARQGEGSNSGKESNQCDL